MANTQASRRVTCESSRAGLQAGAPAAIARAAHHAAAILAALATGQAAGTAARGGVVADQDLRAGHRWGALAGVAILAGIGTRFEGRSVALIEQGRADAAAPFAAGGRGGSRAPTFWQAQG